MIDLYVFDRNFNRLGEVSEYKELAIERRYYAVSTTTLRIAGTKENIDLLQQGRIITTANNINYGYQIDYMYYVDEAETELEIIAYSLNYWLYWRIIERQMRFTGNAEDVIKKYVNAICINPTNLKRKIPNLVLAANSGISSTVDSSKSGGELGEHLFELCKSNEMTVDILMNHSTRKFEVYTWQGVDRSTLQTTNPPVIFSKEFDNVINQQYTKSYTDYKNVAVVAGEGEGDARQVAIYNDEPSGFDRREVYIDARNVRSEYRDENDNEVVLTSAEYASLLREQGKEQLAEYQIIETYESEIDMYSQFVYGVDYGLGDKVSNRNDELGKILHARVVTATLTSNRNGTNLNVEFGNESLDIYKRIFKKKVK